MTAAAGSDTSLSNDEALTLQSLKTDSLKRHAASSSTESLEEAGLPHAAASEDVFGPAAAFQHQQVSRQATIHCNRDLPLSLDSSQFQLHSAQLLGEGAFARAYKVYHTGMRRHLVLKRLKQADTEEEFGPEHCLFRKEMRTLQRLHHRHVLGFYGLMYTKQLGLTIVTELAAGGSLHSLLHAQPQAPLSAQRRLLLAKHVASGMAYLHANSIVHRDLTSSNCFLRSDGTAVVADFGLAAQYWTDNFRSHPDYTRLVRGCHLTDCVGNFFYVSPEMFQRREYDFKTDLYSYGVLLCELALRLPPDPELLPRLPRSFAVDQQALRQLAAELAPDWPRPALQLAVDCVAEQTEARPQFREALARIDSCLIGALHGRVVL